MGGNQAGQVRRRRVFYIPGYDPIHPRRYRELYRTESGEQARISGYDIALRARSGAARYGWHVTAQIDGANVEAEIDVLVWSDIVRTSMSNSIPATYWQLIRTAFTYIFTGALFRLMRLRKGPVIAALYPVGMLLGQLLIAAIAFYYAAHGIGRLGQFVGRLIWPDLWFSPLFMPTIVAAMITGLVVGFLVLRWFKARDGRFFAYYLMHDYAYSARYLGANPPELEARIAQFTALIREALASDVDEVLVVGHSSGAHVGVSVLADLLRERTPDGPALSFLTLRQVVPMVSFLPRADRLRADLAFLSTRDDLTWVDVSAPGDGCAFALCDPVGVTGVAPADKRWPLVISAAFTQTLSPERWKALRWRFFRLHFQYLCAFDRPKDYDYFQITAGPSTLGARFKGRKPSNSRLSDPVSGYRSMRAL
ncbi:MAG: hypothetical protein AB8B51_04015 [Sedimentitalea sp.]